MALPGEEEDKHTAKPSQLEHPTQTFIIECARTNDSRDDHEAMMMTTATVVWRRPPNATKAVVGALVMVTKVVEAMANVSDSLGRS
eukprot:4404956-Alexandrium_andersonii.AAC.1